VNRRAAAGTLVVGVLAACSGEAGSRVRVTGGSPELGAQAIKKYGCGSCHTIPGIKGATALVGPPLVHFSQRTYIAGELANSPDNLARWIEDPKGVEPQTAMPDLGVSAGEARNIAAYLLSLR
jgi:cytochrome c1